MPTTSYPAVGDGGLSEAQWAKLYDNPDGIINDYAGTAFALTLNAATNVATIGVSTAPVIISGFALEVTAAEDLAVPTSAGTYYIAAMYDPTLNIADGSGNALPAGPCRLVISSSLSTSAGKQYSLLYGITRTTGQALTAATVTDYRRWTGPVIVWPYTQPNGPVGASYPRGTIRYDSLNERLVIRDMNAAGTAMEWRAFQARAAVRIPVPSALVAMTANAPASYLREGTTVRFQGTLRRASGATLSTTSGDVTLGTMPVGVRPEVQVRFSCTAKKPVGWDAVQVTVREDGLIIMYNPSGFDVDFVDLSGISYRIGG